MVLDTAGHLAAIAVERSRAEDRLARLTLHDPLMALPNRVLLCDRPDTALRRMSRHQQSVAVLFLDLDRSKVINDSLGHGAGDELLAALAARLQTSVRPGDTVARFGGDVVLTASVGIAPTSSADDDPDRLLDAAMRDRAVTRLQLEGDLRQGLARGEFVVHYPAHPRPRRRPGRRRRGARPLEAPGRDLPLPLDFLSLG